MLARLPTRSGILCVTLSFAVVQMGCVTVPTADGSGASRSGASAQAVALTPAEQRMREQSSQLDVKSSIQGCLAGAAAGALVGMLAGGKRSNNMLVGAAIGCGVGLGANAYVQSKRSQYHTEEQRMAAIIADVQADNKKLASLISTSQEVIAADRRRIAEIDKAYRKKSISMDDARRQMASVKANRDHLQKTANSLKKKEQNWIEVSNLEKQAGSDTAKLDTEIKKLQSKVSGLEKEVQLMDKQINVSPVAA